jgi:hypothetical protein
LLNRTSDCSAESEERTRTFELQPFDKRDKLADNS